VYANKQLGVVLTGQTIPFDRTVLLTNLSVFIVI